MMTRSDDIKAGDRVRLARHSFLTGTVDKIEFGAAHVRWDDDDPEDPAYDNVIFDPEHSLTKMRQRRSSSS